MRLGFIAAFAMIAGALAHEGVLSGPLAFLAFVGMMGAYWGLCHVMERAECKEEQEYLQDKPIRDRLISRLVIMSEAEHQQLATEACRRLGRKPPNRPISVIELIDLLLAAARKERAEP